ncbi:MAG: hypothetical protein QW303_02775, partial [Nitrososphaerota archaeon]
TTNTENKETTTTIGDNPDDTLNEERKKKIIEELTHQIWSQRETLQQNKIHAKVNILNGKLPTLMYPELYANVQYEILDILLDRMLALRHELVCAYFNWNNFVQGCEELMATRVVKSGEGNQ